MGVDLTLLPIDSERCPVVRYSHTVLEVVRDYDLFKRIEVLHSKEIYPGFNSYVSREGDIEECHYGLTVEDAYGRPVRCVLAKYLKEVDIPGATGAYVAALPDDYEIALYWH